MKRLPTVIALAVAATLVGACSSGGGSGAPQVTSTISADLFKPVAPDAWSDAGNKVDASKLDCAGAAPDPARGITDTSVKVGGLAYLTSPSGSSMSGADAGAAARFKAANDAGGVNGRKIDYIGTKDDALDAARNVQQAQTLVDQDKVFAVVPEMTSSANYLDTFCSKVVPYFGWGFNTGFCDTAIGFPITGCLVSKGTTPDTANWGAIVRQLLGKDASTTASAVVGNDSDSSRAGVASIARQIELAGVPVAYAKTPIPSAGLNDATPIVSALMSADHGNPVGLVIMPGDFTSMQRLVEPLRAAGYTGQVISAVTYDPRLAAAKIKSIEGVNTILQWAPSEADSPGMKRLKADFAKYAPNQSISLPAMAGYWAADMFVDALTKTGRNLTVDSFLKTLNGGGYTYYANGATPQVRFPLNHSYATPCGGLVALKNGGYDQTVPFACSSLLPKGK